MNVVKQPQEGTKFCDCNMSYVTVSHTYVPADLTSAGLHQAFARHVTERKHHRTNNSYTCTYAMQCSQCNMI